MGPREEPHLPMWALLPPPPSITSAPPGPSRCPTYPHMPGTGSRVRAPLCHTRPPCRPGRPVSTNTRCWVEAWVRTGTSSQPPPPSPCRLSRKAPRRDASRWPLFSDDEEGSPSRDATGLESRRRGLTGLGQWRASPASRAFTPKCVTIKTLPSSLRRAPL